MITVGIIAAGTILGFLTSPILTILSIIIAVIRLIKIALS